MGIYRILVVLVAAALLAIVMSRTSAPVVAHGGGLDRYGCHRDNKAGNYHCHRGPCAGNTFTSQAAMLAATCSKP
jgi:hypothetical protein